MDELIRDCDREIADRWTGEFCALDGKPAKIIGRLRRFAIVYVTDGTGAFQVEYSWPCVDHVMTTTKRFNS